jgi:hypothetical protein
LLIKIGRSPDGSLSLAKTSIVTGLLTVVSAEVIAGERRIGRRLQQHGDSDLAGCLVAVAVTDGVVERHRCRFGDVRKCR